MHLTCISPACAGHRIIYSFAPPVCQPA